MIIKNSKIIKYTNHTFNVIEYKNIFVKIGTWLIIYLTTITNLK